MDLGIGIGIAGVAGSTAAVLVTAIKNKPNGNGNGNGKSCSLHSGIEATLNFLKEGQKRIEEKLDKVIGGE
jgi:ABC-type phosphate transport system permease subunit